MPPETGGCTRHERAFSRQAEDITHACAPSASDFPAPAMLGIIPCRQRPIIRHEAKALFGIEGYRVLRRHNIHLANAMAGRFSGGPAKVTIFASGLFGRISGSSIANSCSRRRLNELDSGRAPMVTGTLVAAQSTHGVRQPSWGEVVRCRAPCVGRA
ncbi:MAG: TRAP transporter large permease subunit [Methylobacterium sp.]|nr:TRAP transporter large permease subunit [Methylobacterium sp.]